MFNRVNSIHEYGRWARRCAALVVMAALSAAGPVRAGAAQLDGYVQEAWRSNLALQQQRLSLARGVEALREARGAFLPSLSFEARYTDVRGGGLDLGEVINPIYATLNQLLQDQAFPTDLDLRLPLAQETKLRLVQPVVQPALFANYTARESQLEVERAALRVFARQLAADVKSAYFAYAKAVRVVELLDSTQPLLDENLRLSEQLVVTGKVTEEAVYRARAELAELAQRRTEAVLHRESAARYFNFLLNREPAAAISLDEQPPALELADVEPAAAAAEAVRQREELTQLGHALDAAEARVCIAAAAFLPSMAVAVDYGFHGNDYDFDLDGDFLAASIVLRWSLFEGFQDAARKRQAELDAARLASQRAELEQRIAMQARQAADEVRAGLAAMATARERLKSAARSFELVSGKYAQGVASHIEYLDARTTFTGAQLNEALTQYDYLLRQVHLERALARLPLANLHH